MKSSALPIVESDTPEYGARQALADAIRALDRARQKRTHTASAIVRAMDIVAEAETKLAEARSGVALAQDSRARQIEAAATTGGEGTPAGPTLRDARVAEAEAQDELEAATRAVEALRSEIGANHTSWQRGKAVLVDDVYVAERTIEARVDDVFRATSFDTFIVETVAMQRELVGRRLVLGELIKQGLIGEATTETPALRSLMAAFQLPQWWYPSGPGYLCGSEEIDAHPLSRRWRDVRAAMKADADVPFPDGFNS